LFAVIDLRTLCPVLYFHAEAQRSFVHAALVLVDLLPAWVELAESSSALAIRGVEDTFLHISEKGIVDDCKSVVNKAGPLLKLLASMKSSVDQAKWAVDCFKADEAKDQDMEEKVIQSQEVEDIADGNEVGKASDLEWPSVGTAEQCFLKAGSPLSCPLCCSHFCTCRVLQSIQIVSEPSPTNYTTNNIVRVMETLKLIATFYARPTSPGPSWRSTWLPPSLTWLPASCSGFHMPLLPSSLRVRQEQQSMSRTQLNKPRHCVCM